MRLLQFFLLLLLLLVQKILLLQPLVFADSFVRPVQGVRNLGMGNVGIALSHDENALFYNPAGLARVEETYGSFNFILGASEDIVRLSQKNSVKVDDVEKVGDVFELILDKTFYVRGTGSVNLLLPIVHSMTFGASYFYDSETVLALENAVLPQLFIGTRLDEGQAFGISLPVADDKSVVLGVGARIINKRVELPHRVFTLSKIIRAGDDTDSLFPKGTDTPARGVGGDFGLQWRLAGNFKITIGAVAQNIGNMRFLRKAGATTPKDRKMEIGVGVSIQPEIGPFRILSAIDIKDLTMQGTNDRNLEKRTHMGIEVGLFPMDSTSSVAAVRSGYNQGYATFGVEVNPLVFSNFLTINYALYGEELGSSSGEIKDSRALLQISLKLGEILL